MTARKGTTPMERHLAVSHEGIRAVANLAGALEDVDRIDHLAVLARLRDNQDGQPGAASYDGPSVTGSPTPRMPIRLTKDGRLAEDRARQAEADYIDAMVRATPYLRTMARIAANNEPRDGTNAPRLRNEAEAQNRHEPKCAPCAKAGRDELARLKNPTDCGGRLEVGERLCRWHEDFVYTADRMASDEETRKHHNGQTVRLRAS